MLEECAKYFKDNNAYKRIFLEMQKKWKKYGKVSGFIVLENATRPEREALKLIMGRSFDNEVVKVKMSEFESALNETKYKEIGLKELLEEYFNEKLITNKNKRQEKSEAKQQFFDEIVHELSQDQSKNDDAIRWIESIAYEKKYGYNLINIEYEKHKDIIKKIIIMVCKAIDLIQSLDEEKIRLAVLSAEITSNPHFFDKGKVAGKLLIYALSFINGSEYPKDSETILELYYMFNVKPDDISSYTTAYGISLYNEDGIHKSYEIFIENSEAYVVTISNLSKIVSADCKSKKVFIFENQMVFSHMCESLVGMPVSMICTSGQMKTASLILIDLLCKSGCTLYYSGDIDPEGIGIADRVISRDPVHIIPWRVSKSDYILSISSEELNEVSIKKLEKVEDNRFKEVIEVLKDKKRAGYQELLIDKMLTDIKEKMIQY